jgi:hypothetical protein
MTELTLVREPSSTRATLGKLAIGGVFECHTLEDVIRPDGVKVTGATAIPAGRYEVVLSFSMRFNRVLPMLLNVPGFTAIRIHSGNTAGDTRGCILVGQRKGEDVLFQSLSALSILMLKLQLAVNSGKVFITIVDEVHA